MKQALSLLTAFVTLQMQTWALSGGPVYPTGAPNQAGTYAGVMRQVDARFGNEFDQGAPNSGTTSNLDLPAGSIGAYTIAVPTEGLTSGSFVLFVNGTLYSNGNITGVADPDEGTFDGVMSATRTFVDQNGNNVIVPIAGQINTRIIEKTTTPQPGRTDTADGNAARIKGTALVDAYIDTNVNLYPIPQVQVKYSVVGFRQSTTAL